MVMNCHPDHYALLLPVVAHDKESQLQEADLSSIFQKRIIFKTD